MVSAHRTRVNAEYLDPFRRFYDDRDSTVNLNKEEIMELPLEVIMTVKEIQIWKLLRRELTYETVCLIKQYTLGSTNIWKQGQNWQCAECMRRGGDKVERM